MATGLSALADAYHPQLAKLRQQLEGLVPDRAAAAVKEAVAHPSTLLDQVKANAPLLMELGSTLLSRVRQSSGAVAGHVAEAASVQRRPQSLIGRVGYKTPILVIAAALGAAYFLGRAHRAPRSAATPPRVRRNRAGVA